jgi:hypothetical protein
VFVCQIAQQYRRRIVGTVLVDDEVGSEQVTQFVGSIRRSRTGSFSSVRRSAFHSEVRDECGPGESNTPIEAGSCIYLPKTQVHCVENTGTDELRLLGVFYPAGSPSVIRKLKVEKSHFSLVI